MSLATRCPACGTIFRVVQDQLRVSEGWVRCGQCQEVFQGIEALFDLDNDPVFAARRAAAQSAAMPPPTHVFAAQRANAAIPEAAARPTMAPRFAARLAEDAARALGRAAPPVAAPPPIDAAPAWQGLVLDMPQPFGTQAFAPNPAPMHLPPDPFVPEQADPAPASGQAQASETSPPLQAPHEAAEPAPVSAPPAAGDTPPTPPAPEIDDEPDAGGSTIPSMLAEDDDIDEARAGPPTLASMLPQDTGHWPPRRTARRASDATPGTELALVDRRKDPRFLREARKGARWRRPGVRAVLGVALMLLIVAAAAQVAWPQRDMLAARWPDTLPAWNWLCAQAGCRIAAPRAIASLALDGSSLTRTDTDHVLLFSADLHNRAEHPVAVPSFDVTFMDLNGAIVARKVLTPAQIGIRQGALPAEGELHVHARLQVGTLAASGFQADLFYP